MTLSQPIRSRNLEKPKKNLVWLQNKHGGGTIQYFIFVKAKNFPPGNSTSPSRPITHLGPQIYLGLC